MASEKGFYTREEYDLIIGTINEPDQVIAKMLGIEPAYVTRNPSEIKIYHAVIRENEKVLGEVTITGKVHDFSDKGRSPSLTFTSLDSDNNKKIKKSLDNILNLNKIKVI